MKNIENKTMQTWFWYAVGAAVLYGLHQIFTKLKGGPLSAVPILAGGAALMAVAGLLLMRK